MASSESRKQQYGATALVMGLVPLTLKDVAWPHRRVVPVTKPLPAILEVLVRALGADPVEGDHPQGWTEVQRWKATREWMVNLSPIGEWAWSLRSRLKIGLLLLTTTIVLLGTFAAMAVVEIYSKRASLGCPYPVFVLTWHICSLAPALIHTIFYRIKSHRKNRRVKNESMAETEAHVKKTANQLDPGHIHPPIELSPAKHLTLPKKRPDPYHRLPSARKIQIISAVQGGEEWWGVQLCWAVFYIAGTLIYTSIMAVTVVELFVWVAVSCAVAGMSKLLSFFVCISIELARIREAGELHGD
jgi:hypothetical protein